MISILGYINRIWTKVRNMTDETTVSAASETVSAPVVSSDVAISATQGATVASTASDEQSITKRAVAAVEAELAKVEVSIVSDFDSVAAKIKDIHKKLGIELHSGWDEIVALAKKL